MRHRYAFETKDEFFYSTYEMYSSVIYTAHHSNLMKYVTFAISVPGLVSAGFSCAI